MAFNMNIHSVMNKLRRIHYGKHVFKIKKIGNIVSYIQNVRGLINIVIFAIIVFVLISLNDKQKNSRKIKRKKYEIKKIRDNYHL